MRGWRELERTSDIRADPLVATLSLLGSISSTAVAMNRWGLPADSQRRGWRGYAVAFVALSRPMKDDSCCEATMDDDLLECYDLVNVLILRAL